MSRRTAHNALQPTEVRYQHRYRKRNRSRGKWLRMLRRTLLSRLACALVRSWMRGRMRMCNISRFRNNTHTHLPYITFTSTKSLLFLFLPFSIFQGVQKASSERRQTIWRNNGSLFFLLVFSTIPLYAHGAAATLYVVIDCILTRSVWALVILGNGICSISGV